MMSDMNVVALSGTLRWDTEPKFSEKGSCTCPFKLETKRKFGDKEYSDTVDCVCFGDAALIMADASAGDRIVVVGRVGSRSYEDGEKKRYMTQVVAEQVEVIKNVG